MNDRELDALIAEKLFGYDEEHDQLWSNADAPIWNGSVLPEFTTDPAACALVLDEMRKRWPQVTGQPGRFWQIVSLRSDTWSVMVREEDAKNNIVVAQAEEENLWRAVCLAALRALGVNNEL